MVRFTQPGWHHWPDAHGVRSYLGAPHRHLFHVTVCAPVGHDDRDMEFHDLRDDAAAAFAPLCGTPDAPVAASCETMARALLDALDATAGWWAEVWEDDECGARVDA